MRFALFYHSVISDWNHGNAHFLRGYATELIARGHEVRIFEPRDGWSLASLRAEHGERPVQDFGRAFPHLLPTFYDPTGFDLRDVVEWADVTIVHEWSDAALVARINALARGRPEALFFFHDTHHRACTAPDEMARYDLSDFSGVLAFGEVIRRTYLERAWCRRAWTWHEAADTRIFTPRDGATPEGDLVWIGNWGDGERARELLHFLIEPVRDLRLSAVVHGVRYPPQALRALERAGIEYRGWLPNQRVPDVFARFRLTVHVPRRPYAQALPGIPTIRPFEAMACGLPLVSAPWLDVEGLFEPGLDHLVARDGDALRACLVRLLEDPGGAQALAGRGLARIRARHTCAHRVDELLELCRYLRPDLEVHQGARDAVSSGAAGGRS